MKPSKELYQSTFSRLKASPTLRKELLTMTEQVKRPKKFVVRRLIAVAAVLALVFALAMGANAATGGELYEATIGKLVYSFKLDNGATARVYQGTTDDGGRVSFIVEEDGETAEGTDGAPTGEVYKSVEVETDENGNIISIQER